VHLTEFPSGTAAWRDEAVEARWRRLFEVRSAVQLVLEGARQDKRIGSNLSAHVDLGVSDPALFDLVARYAADLPMFFITSSVAVHRAAEGAAELAIDVGPAPGTKCPRCWRIVVETMPDGDLAGLCARCADAVGDTVATA
jgi:isoleucyl-tRNA synthetase